MLTVPAQRAPFTSPGTGVSATPAQEPLAEAVAAGQLGPGADSDEAIHFLAVFICGCLGMAIANDPDMPWGTGRYTPLLARLIDLLVVLYPPDAPAAKAARKSKADKQPRRS
jgi:hypothetical protein